MLRIELFFFFIGFFVVYSVQVYMVVGSFLCYFLDTYGFEVFF